MSVELKDRNHKYYSVSTLREIIDEIKDEHRWDIPTDGCYTGGIVTAITDLVGKLNARHPDVVITQEAIDVHQMQNTINELRAKNKELNMRMVLDRATMRESTQLRELLENDLKSARVELNSKDAIIRSLEKQCDDLGKELTQLKNCDYFTLEQMRELVPEYLKLTDNALPSEAIYADGWNACARAMNNRIAMTPPAGHTLSETMQVDSINKLKTEVQAFEERIKQLTGELFFPLAKEEKE